MNVTHGLKRTRTVVATLVASLALGAGAAAAPAVPAAGHVEHAPQTETAVLAGGCFWGMELVFESLKGVSNVVSGYSGGPAAAAEYETVSNGTTGHAESVEITFDPRRISYERLLDVYFRVAHDPTQLNRQGPDAGTQYRSAIFYASEAQRRAALAYIHRLTAAKTFTAPIVTQVVPLHGFYAAEGYHQHFAAHNPAYPYIVYNDAPKLAALHERYPQLVKAAN